MSSYLIGIDFGTTNCTMAYANLQSPDEGISQFPISQFGLGGSFTSNPSLPSFLYFPLAEELAKKALALPWDPKSSHCVGHFAKQRGAELPERLITSVKSWLCHAAIDRHAALLPLEAADLPLKKSPLEAAGDILRHLRGAWDTAFADAPFAEQEVLITVPASFDPSARELVLEAAAHAGYPEVILLEEPLAAFYAWLATHQDNWRDILKVGDRVLVVDIGGGTTDFSLIAVDDSEGNLQLTRTAVGNHLLLGGDNIDLSLAYLAKAKFEELGHSIDEWQLQAIIHRCRDAKEQLLGENPPASMEIVVMGRGSRLIGNSLKVALTLEEVATIVVEGFMPLVASDQYAHSERRYAIQQVGLPYAQDPRITAQLAKFLSQTGESGDASIAEFVVPSVVLFNGGTTKASAFRQRLLQQINGWAEELKRPPVAELPQANYDFAVSRGAVSYGLARHGKAIRIKSGTSRSYFVGVEAAIPAVPGIPKPLQAICVAPFGMEEGSEQCLQRQSFSLVVGEPAVFRFFSHATPTLADGSTADIGTIVKKWQLELTELPPIEALLDKCEGDSKVVQVQLKSKVTELGMLELWCVAADGRSWKLEFDVRGKS
jgi:hypothetical protein